MAHQKSSAIIHASSNPPKSILLPLFVWVPSIFIGYLLTSLIPLSFSNWRWVAGVRIFLQLGTTIWFFVALALVYGKYSRRLNFFKGMTVGLLGIVFCYNALLDLIQGPISFQAEVVKEVTYRGKIYRSGGGFSPTIYTQVEFKKSNGTVYNIKVRGLQANKWDNFWRICYSPSGKNVETSVLSRLKIFLSLKCLEVA